MIQPTFQTPTDNGLEKINVVESGRFIIVKRTVVGLLLISQLPRANAWSIKQIFLNSSGQVTNTTHHIFSSMRGTLSQWMPIISFPSVNITAVIGNTNQLANSSFHSLKDSGSGAVTHFLNRMPTINMTAVLSNTTQMANLTFHSWKESGSQAIADVVNNLGVKPFVYVVSQITEKVSWSITVIKWTLIAAIAIVILRLVWSCLPTRQRNHEQIIIQINCDHCKSVHAPKAKVIEGRPV